MDILHSKRILFISRDMTLGGAAYLTLRYINQLLPYFQVDLLITGLIDETMLNQLPKEIKFFTLNALALENQLNLLEFFIRHKEIEVFQSVYSAVLATSVFPDWPASFSECRNKISIFSR